MLIIYFPCLPGDLENGYDAYEALCSSNKSLDLTNQEMQCWINFIVDYVSKIYGKRYIENWMKLHKGKSLLDLITMSDLAYCVLLIDCYHKKW